VHHEKTFFACRYSVSSGDLGVYFSEAAASAGPHCFLRRKRRSWRVLAKAAGFEVFAVLSSASACNQLSSAFPSGKPFCFKMKYGVLL
jgi:hypothetical protein